MKVITRETQVSHTLALMFDCIYLNNGNDKEEDDDINDYSGKQYFYIAMHTTLWKTTDVYNSDSKLHVIWHREIQISKPRSYWSYGA